MKDYEIKLRIENNTVAMRVTRKIGEEAVTISDAREEVTPFISIIKMIKPLMDKVDKVIEAAEYSEKQRLEWPENQNAEVFYRDE